VAGNVQTTLRSLTQYLGRLVVPPAPAAPLEVRRVQLKLLRKKISPVRALVALPFATLLWIVFYLHTRSPGALIWAGLVSAVALYSYMEWKRLDRLGPIPDERMARELEVRTRRIMRHIFMHGVAWGLTPWLLSPHADIAYRAWLTAYLIGALSTGAVMLSTHRQAVAAFCLPLGAGLVTSHMWYGGVGWALAAALILHLAVCLRWTSQQSDQLVESLTVRFEKEELARRLTQQVALVEAANREKSRFFAAASHDLRQPLHAISLFTAVLERTRFDDDTTDTVGRLAHSVRILSDSLDSMLDVAKLDAGAVEPQPRPMPVHDLFLALHTTYGARAADKGLQLRLRAPGDLLVLSDAQLLERLLGNLIDNAVKYTRHGGVVVAARTGRWRGHPGQVCFDVVDTGIGIPEEHQQRVFDEFYQVDNPQRDRSFGLGIGLSIVKRLSGLLGHPVTLRSRLRRGTRFQVLVPHAQEFAAAGIFGSEALLSPVRKLPAHVLVVDDEADNRQALAALLSSHGCKVTGAGDVDEAEQLLSRLAVDMVLADFRLPGPRNGLDFLLQLRAEHPRLRMLLVTGETAPDRIAEIRESGVPCLYKPVRAQQLLAALASGAHDEPRGRVLAAVQGEQSGAGRNH
jgi:signal transduction histidine kinase/CheY-like chemotaxis protein